MKKKNIIVVLVVVLLVVSAFFVVSVIQKDKGKDSVLTDLSTSALKETTEQPKESETNNSTTTFPETALTTGETTTSKLTVTTETKTTVSETSVAQTSVAQTTVSSAVISESLTPLEQVKSVCGKKYVSKTTGRTVVDPNNSNWNLIVVNSGREYVSSYTPALSEAVKGSGKYLDKRVAPYYQKMYDAAKKDGIILTPYSAYRSYDRQKNNYENLTKSYMTQYSLSKADAAKKAATVILPPGTSEHNLGLAMDIINTKNSFANTKEYAWLVKNAQDYGFILRYTAEKQPITGIVPEPWHWRYVGIENAKKIKASGLCLEEFLDLYGIEY